MAHLFVFVGGCSSSDGDGNGDGDRAIGVTVTPSVTEGIPPLSVTFDVDGKVALTEPAIWDFDDGTTFESVGTRSVSHTFLESRTYNVTASFGAIGSDDLIVVATPITVDPIIVTVTPSVTEGISPLSVTFDVDAEVALTEPAIWDFGDGTTFESVGTQSVSHTFLESGQYNVTASFGAIGSDHLIVVATPITVSQNVNLIVSSFAIDTEVTPGGLETISAIIQNIGTDTFTGDNIQADVHIDVGYFLSTDDIVTVDDIYIGDTSILIGTFFAAGDLAFGFESLAPGENYQFDHQLAVKGNIPAGTYYAGAIVDYIDEFDWYTFPRSTDTQEYQFPTHVVVAESNEDDNVRVLPAYQVTVTAPECIDDAFEADDDSGSATVITVGDTQVHNFCFDNSDWLQFDAIQGGVYKITTFALDLETDTQLILYDTDASSILLFHDNMGNTEDETRTVDLDLNFPPDPTSEIVWEAQATGTYYIKVRTTACDEDLDDHCETLGTSSDLRPSLAPEGFGSPDGVGLDTGYSISLQ